MINIFNKLKKNYPNLKLIILGEGEEKKELMDMINKFNLKKDIFLKGFQKNAYLYMQNAEGLIMTSISENPGHVLIEAAANNCPIISSNCPTGPSEFLDNGKGGFLFKTNDDVDFIDKFKSFINQTNNEKHKKKFYAKKNSINYTCFRHYLQLIKAIN